MRIFMIVAILLSQGCALMPDGSVPLYERFHQYKTAVDDGSIVGYYKDFFAPKLVDEVDVESPAIQSQLSFAQYMQQELSHFQTFNQKAGCLTINGMTPEQSPVAFYIKYESISNQWLMSDIDVSLLETVDQFKEQALCPEEVRIN